MSACDRTSACHSRTEAMPSPTAAAPTPRFGIVTLRKMPAFARSAISRSTRVEDVFNASICAIVTHGGIRLRKLRTSAIRVEFMPAFSGMSLNMLLRMYSIYCSISPKLRSSASEAISPVSSSCSSSSYEIVFSEGNERFLRLVEDGDVVVRFSPKAATALVRLGLAMRDERAGVVWKDILQSSRLLLRLRFEERVDNGNNQSGGKSLSVCSRRGEVVVMAAQGKSVS
jgi:hypothetical protein